MAALIFNGNKIITTSGGGALVSQHKHYIDQARFLATQAKDNAPHYQHSQIGFNYRMSNIVAGIGRGQVEVLDERVAQRKAKNQRYRDFFASVDGVTFQIEPDTDYYSKYWLTAILINPAKTDGINREVVRLALDAENIESRHFGNLCTCSQFMKGPSFSDQEYVKNYLSKGYAYQVVPILQKKNLIVFFLY